MRSLILVFSMLIGGFVGNTFAHEAHTKNSANKLAISMAFDQQGLLWRARVRDGIIFVDKSTDKGTTFSKPTKVNAKPQKIAAKGEARPKIAIAPHGNIYLTWTQGLTKRFTGYIWFSRSIDGGKSFEKPKIVHQDRAEITHRFDALNVAKDGKITIAWVDKRDLEAAKKVGRKYTGAAIYYATSNNAGKSFAIEKKLADYSCECCRIAITNKPDGTPVAMWRHVFPGSERDHAIAEINNQRAKIIRASYGHWKLDGCPHHGAALTYGEGFGYHMAYFDGAGETPSLKYARMDGEAWVSSPPKRFGNMQHLAGHPAILSAGENVYLVWQERNAGKPEIHGMQSYDGGRSWTDVQLIVSKSGKLDYPELNSHKNTVYLTVNSELEGLKVIEISK